MLLNPYPPLFYGLLTIFIPVSIWISIKKTRSAPYFGLIPWCLIGIDQAKRASDALLLQKHCGNVIHKIVPPWFAMSGLFVPGLILALVLLGAIIVLFKMFRLARQQKLSVFQSEAKSGGQNAWKLFGVPAVIFYTAMCWWNQFALWPILLTDQGIVHGRTKWNLSAELVPWEKIKSFGAAPDKQPAGAKTFAFTFIHPDGSDVTRKLVLTSDQENELQDFLAREAKNAHKIETE